MKLGVGEQGRKNEMLAGELADIPRGRTFSAVTLRVPEGDTSSVVQCAARLEAGGRLVALLPKGDTSAKRLAAENSLMRLTAEVLLPGGERLVTIDRARTAEKAKEYGDTVTVDLTGEKTMEAAIAKLKDVTLPERKPDMEARWQHSGEKAIAYLKAQEATKGLLGKSKFGSNPSADEGWVRFGTLPKGFLGMLGKCGVFNKGSMSFDMLRNPQGAFLDELRNLYAASKMSAEEIADKTYRGDERKHAEAVQVYARTVLRMAREISGKNEYEFERLFSGKPKKELRTGEKMDIDGYRDLFKSHSTDAELNGLFDKVYDVAKDLGLRIDVYSDPSSNAGAFYDSDNRIRINIDRWNSGRFAAADGQVSDMNDERRAELLCHELIHSVTSYALYGYENGTLADKRLWDAAENMARLYEEIRSHPGGWYVGRMYAMKNSHELVAELSNPIVRQQLQKLGFWKRIVNGVARFFGWRQPDPTETTNAREAVEDALDKLLASYSPEEYKAFVNQWHEQYNNESPAVVGEASGLGLPTRKGATMANVGAKVSGNAETRKNLGDLLNNVSKKAQGAHELLFGLAKAFGYKGESLAASQYFKIGDDVTLRLADHQGNAGNFREHDEQGENYGVAIKLNGAKFKTSKGVDYLEMVYYPDRLDGERQKALVRGLRDFITDGDVSHLPQPDRANGSGRYKEFRLRSKEAEQAYMQESDPQTMRQAAEHFAASVGVKVNVVTDASELPDNGKREALGFTENGEATIVVANHKSVGDVLRTAWHEVISHVGLRQLLGEERYNKVCRKVFWSADLNKWGDEMVASYEDMAAQGILDGVFSSGTVPKRFRDLSSRQLVEYMYSERVQEYVGDELLANHAEEGRFRTVSNIKILKGALRDLAHRLGISEAFTEDDYDYLHWRAKRKLGTGSEGAEGTVRFRNREETKDYVLKLFHDARRGDITGKPVAVGRLTDEGREYLKRISGIEMKGDVSFVLNPSDLAHIYRRHFGDNERDERNVPLTEDDIRDIVSIVSNPDKVIYKKEDVGDRRNMFFFLKGCEGGSFNLLEIYADRKGNLTAKSFFKSKEGVSQRAISLGETLHSTSETDGATLFSGAKIPTLFEPAKETGENVSPVRYRRVTDEKKLRELDEADGGQVKFRKREKPDPTRTIKMYKLFKVDSEGKPHALFIDRANALERGVFYDADSPQVKDLEHLDVNHSYLLDANGNVVESRETEVARTGGKARFVGLPPKSAVNKATEAGQRWMTVTLDAAGSRQYHTVGINGSDSVSTFALRPGWHATDKPTARHIGNGYRRPDERWFEIEVAADKDYNEEARQRYMREHPKMSREKIYQELKGDIPERIPEDGFYDFRTNSNANPKQRWVISGSMRIVRPISEAETRRVCQEQGVEGDLPYIKGKAFSEDDTKETTLRYRRVTDEEREIAERAKNDGTYMKAPNGADTRLTTEQWTQVRTKAFKEFFGDWEKDPENASKVVDENGEPLVVYHGTRTRFNTFRKGDLGFHFGTSEQARIAAADHCGTRIMPCHLNIRHPYVMKHDPLTWDDFGNDFVNALVDDGIITKEQRDGVREGYGGTRTVRTALLNAGYDGVTYPNEYEFTPGAEYRTRFAKSYIALLPGQIKSATDNNGEFSSRNADIRYRRAETRERVGREGLDAAIGREAHTAMLDALMRDTGNEALKGMRREIGARAARNGWDIREAAARWLADKAAADTADTDLWDDVREMMSPAVPGVTVPEARYLSWLSQNKGRQRDPMFLAEAAAMRQKIERMDYTPQIKDGEYVERGESRAVTRFNAAAGDVRFRKAQKRALETATWQARDAQANQATVVSSADGAKVQKEIEKYTKVLEEKTAKTKNFLGDLARAIGARQHGSGSQYATFTTPDGSDVTIRLANHNAAVSTFDHNGESEGVSIVITNRNNRQLTNDGEAHVVEYYYNKGKLAKTEGKPLAEIARSVGECLKTGEYTDTTGLAERQEVNVPVTHYRKSTPTPSTRSALQEYDRRLKRNAFKLRESFIDSMESVRELQRAATGEKDHYKVADSENVYVAQNLASSRADTEWGKWHAQHFGKVEKAVDEIVGVIGGGRSEAIAEIERYMVMKHGLERNRVLYVRDQIAKAAKTKREKLQADWDTTRHNLSYNDFGTYLDGMDVWITENLDNDYDPNRNDYSGISALDPDRKVGKGHETEWDEGIVRQEVDDTESRYGHNRVRDLWRVIGETTGDTVDRAYHSGQTTKEGAQKIKGMFSFYVPLRGFNEATMEETYGDYIGGNGAGAVRVLRDAKGRHSLSGSPLDNISQMGQAACLAAEQARVAQTFYRLAVKHPTDAISLSAVWEVKDANGEWQPTFAEMSDGDTAERIAANVRDFNERMEQLKANGEARLRHGRGAFNAPFADRLHKQQHIVRCDLNGITRLIYVNGDPRAAQALNGLVRNDREKGTLTPKKLLDWKAGLTTSYAPEFIVSNSFRDFFFANANIATKENGAYWRKFCGNQQVAFGALSGLTGSKHGNLIKRYYNGTLDPGDHIQRTFAEFMDNGGRTGYTAVQQLEEHRRALLSDIKSGKRTDKSVRRYLKAAGSPIEAVNARAELVQRFATFLTSREMGRTLMRSASDAKEVTVNFNRQGAGNATDGLAGFAAGYARNNIMFFNAGMQSMELLWRNVSRDRRSFFKTVGFMGVMPTVAGTLYPMLMALLCDDKYSRIPSWERRNNWCIPVSEKHYIKIALPIELRAWWGLGDVIASLSDKRLQTGESPWLEALGQITQALPIDPIEGNQGLVSVMPEMSQWGLQYMLNRDWTGKPIERDDKFNPDAPHWTRAFDSTPRWEVALCRMGHDMLRDGKETDQATDKTGDSFLLDPALYDHFLRSNLGGLYSIVGKTADVATEGWRAATGRENSLSVSRAPMLSRLVGRIGDRDKDAVTNAKFYRYKETMDAFSREMKNPANKHNPLAMTELRERPEYKQWQLWQPADKQLKRLRKAMRNARTPELAKDYERRYEELRRDLVKGLDAIDN